MEYLEHANVLQYQIDSLRKSKTCSQYLPWLHKANLTICILAAREVWGIDIVGTIVPYKKNLGKLFADQVKFHKDTKQLWNTNRTLHNKDEWDNRFIERLHG
jgi:hypothetical protein